MARTVEEEAMECWRKLSGLALTAGAALACAAVLGTGPAMAQNKQLTIAMITHAQPGDTFWDIIRKGANAAAKKDNVKLVYLSSPDATKEAQLITNVTQQHVDGIALTLAFPDAEGPAAKAAEKAGIPIVGFNAGTDTWKKLGLLGYAGQDETVAGKAVGEKLNAEGAKNVVCLDQQQGAVQLEARCNGIKSTFKGKFQVLYTTGYDMPTVKSRVQAKLQQDTSIDYVVTLGAPFAPVVLDAINAAGSSAKVGTFDMSPRVINMIAQGKVQWAVDQQPYVEGYEAVDMLWLWITNGDTVGGGQPVLTGPAFVTKDNAEAVAKYAKRGTR
jgi:simple sugar transport system substrate-binding protein